MHLRRYSKPKHDKKRNRSTNIKFIVIFNHAKTQIRRNLLFVSRPYTNSVIIWLQVNIRSDGEKIFKLIFEYLMLITYFNLTNGHWMLFPGGKSAGELSYNHLCSLPKVGLYFQPPYVFKTLRLINHSNNNLKLKCTAFLLKLPQDFNCCRYITTYWV
jgi:hypothetical protein